MADSATGPRRSLRARTSNKRYRNDDDPIIIDDDESITMTASKSGDMSRRTSGTSTPATSVSTLTDDTSLDDAKPVTFADGNEAKSKLPSITPAKARARKSVEATAASKGSANTTLAGRRSARVMPKREEEPIDLTSTQETVRTVPDSSFSTATLRRGRPSRVESKAKAQTSKPVDTVYGAADEESKETANKMDKGKGKQEEQLFVDLDLADYALDSGDEEEAIKRSLKIIGSASNDTVYGHSEDEESEFEAEDIKPRKRARATLLKLAKGAKGKASADASASASRPAGKAKFFEQLDEDIKMKTQDRELHHSLSSEEELSELSDDESSFSSEDPSFLDSDDDENAASSIDVPLSAGPSNGPAPGATGEEQRFETAKQRALRLKREARERRIEANARRTGRARKKDFRSHYEKAAALLHKHHPELKGVWDKLKSLPKREIEMAAQPAGLTIKLLPFQREGVDWLVKQEQSQWKGGILADEMGMGKTIQLISLFLSDRKKPNLVVAPTVAILQWRNEIAKYTEGFKVVVWHGANRSSDANLLKNADVVLVSYGVLESAFRKQVSGFKRKGALIKETSIMHSIGWHRVVLDEAHNIKERATNTAKAAFELQATFRWCLSGTPLQNRVGELYSMIRFLGGDPFSYYYCKRCPCKSLHWQFSDRRSCDKCGHTPMHHTCFWNNEILKPIQRFGTTTGEGRDSFERLRLLLENMMLRRTKLERADDMGLPPRTVVVRRDYFNEEEEDLYESLYSDTTRKFSTFLDQGTVLNNYSNIFTLLTRMRQLACHPDLVLRSNTGIAQKLLGDELASVHVCRICQEEAEDAIMSKCRHIFCRECVRQWIGDGERQDGRPPECPYCHMTLTIDLEGDALDPPRQNDHHGARQGIISRLDMNKWRSSSKIEALVEELTQLRSDDKTIKSLVFSQFVNFLDLIAFRLTRAGFNICRLEGNMTPEARNKTIEHFMNNPGVTVFLVSLKAGGVALNLTEASRVFLMDPWWNPSVEVQAMDRIHRLNQTRPIVVKRMIIENSIESRIVELQNKKSAMIEAAIGKDDSAMGRLSVADLSFLFSL